MFADAPQEPQHVRNQVLSICDLKQSGDVPTGRGCGKMVTIANSLYLFGGVDEKFVFSDLYLLEIEQMKWSKLVGSGEIPCGRFGHSFHAIGPDEIVLFGGFACSTDVSASFSVPFGPWQYKGVLSSEVYILNTRSLVWRKITTTGQGPSGRVFQASCFDSQTNQFLVHGGYLDESFASMSNELFCLNLKTYEWTSCSSLKEISPRGGHAMCSHNGKVYLISDNVLYALDDIDSSNPSISETIAAPINRQFFSLESVGKQLVCFGGQPTSDVYVFTGSEWSKPLYEGSISLRGHQGSVLGDKLMVFGGIKISHGEPSFTRKFFFQSVLEINPSVGGGTKFKLVTVGDSGVGKSCLITRFVSDVYNDFHISTIGVDFKTVVTMVKGKLVRLELWDTAGQERFSVVTGSYYRGADGFVIVYDATSRTSFEHISQWMNQIKQHHDCDPKMTVIILCANKQDRINDIVVSETEGKEKALEIGAIFVATSAKSSANVDLAFLSGAQRLVEIRKAASPTPQSHGLNLSSRAPRATNQTTCCNAA